MKYYKNLLEIIERSDKEIVNYLEDVPIDHFKEDVLKLSKSNVDQDILKDTINRLNKLTL